MIDKTPWRTRVEYWRRDEMQEIHAAISLRSWGRLEQAADRLRDKMDRALGEESETSENYAMGKAGGEVIAPATQIAAMQAALRWYADHFCEFPDEEFCGKLTDLDACSGCKARTAPADFMPGMDQRSAFGMTWGAL